MWLFRGNPDGRGSRARIFFVPAFFPTSRILRCRGSLRSAARLARGIKRLAVVSPADSGLPRVRVNPHSPALGMGVGAAGWQVVVGSHKQHPSQRNRKGKGFSNTPPCRSVQFWLGHPAYLPLVHHLGTANPPGFPCRVEMQTFTARILSHVYVLELTSGREGTQTTTRLR